jgi:small subunit ribosomal protein S17e
MGRVKSTAIKNLARDILEEHGDKFTTDFDKNKKVLASVKKIESIKVRNVVAGYITKVIKRSKKVAA